LVERFIGNYFRWPFARSKRCLPAACLLKKVKTPPRASFFW
jgi:hypothetical protein